jgi:hypothetical protein
VSWIRTISDGLAAYAGLVNAVSAFSTLAAVLVSLKLARAGHKPKLFCSCYVGAILYKTDLPGEYRKTTGSKNIAVSVQNRGPVPVTLTLSSFSWVFRFNGGAFLQNPLNPDMRFGNLVIPPAEGRIVILTDRLDELRKSMQDQKLWFLRWRIRLEVQGSDGVKHYASISKGLRKYLASKT